MTIIADSGALYALYDADDAHHAAVRGVVERSRPSIVVPSLLLVEVDCLLREFLGSTRSWTSCAASNAVRTSSSR